MYTIAKEFAFSASHQLTHLPDEHPCSRLHGHNYVVEVECEAPALDERGFVYDYRNLETVKSMIDHELDHRHLNDVFTAAPTTAEMLAQWLFMRIDGMGIPVSAVTVRETPKTRATYRRVVGRDPLTSFLESL